MESEIIFQKLPSLATSCRTCPGLRVLPFWVPRNTMSLLGDLSMACSLKLAKANPWKKEYLFASKTSFHWFPLVLQAMAIVISQLSLLDHNTQSCYIPICSTTYAPVAIISGLCFADGLPSRSSGHGLQQVSMFRFCKLTCYRYSVPFGKMLVLCFLWPSVAKLYVFGFCRYAWLYNNALIIREWTRRKALI